MERIADVLGLKYPQFNTVHPECLISDALYQMRCENVDFLIVLKEERFLGILTDHDIANHVLFIQKPLNKMMVKEFMTKTLPVAKPGDSLEYAMQLIERYNARHVAVFDNFNFKGVISSYDLMQQALSKRQAIFEDAGDRNAYTWNY